MKRFGIAILLAALCGCTAVDTGHHNPAIVPDSKPATAGTAAGSHTTKTLSTGPAEVGAGRKAFPPPERTTSHYVLGNHDRRDDDTAPDDTTSHDIRLGNQMGPNVDAAPNDDAAAHCEAFGSSRGADVCIGRAAPPAPATSFSGSGVLIKEPLVTANGVGAAWLITTGEYIICKGTLSCAADLDGSYELCLGDHACKDVVHESCVVDVGPPSPLYGRTMTPLDFGFEIHILRAQNEHCKDGKDRVNLYLDWVIASAKLGDEP